jgi:hypothetical protein
MFDQSQPFSVRIFSAGEKIEKLRWPTDEELIERARKMRHIKRNLGRNRTQFETLNEEAVNAELFEKLRLATDNIYDSAEAHKFVQKLLSSSDVTASRSGDEFEVELLVTSEKKRVKHILRMPTQREMNEYHKSSYKAYDIKTGQDIRIACEPAGRLWDSLKISVEGYANGSVPITHKQSALVEMIDLIGQLDDDDPEA